MKFQLDLSLPSGLVVAILTASTLRPLACLALPGTGSPEQPGLRVCTIQKLTAKAALGRFIPVPPWQP